MSATTGFAGQPPHTRGVSHYTVAPGQPSPTPLPASSHSPIKGVTLNCSKINTPKGLRNHSWFFFVYTCNKSQDPERPLPQLPKWNHKLCQIHFYIFFFPQFIFWSPFNKVHEEQSLSLNRNHSESAAQLVHVIIKTRTPAIPTTSLALELAPKSISKTPEQHTPLCYAFSSDSMPRHGRKEVKLYLRNLI